MELAARSRPTPPTAHTALRARLALVLALAVAAGLAVLNAPGFVALAVGVLLACSVGAPQAASRVGSVLLKASVVALGFGVDFGRVFEVGAAGLGAAAVTLGAALALGVVLARRLGVERDTALLLTVGTAICGGAAIAAAAPALRARPAAIGAALAVVFLLNALALVLFPLAGDALQLSTPAFAQWCALAIHDTSSVVGAAGTYGPEALEIATVAKLARSLWIAPVCLGLALFAQPRDLSNRQSAWRSTAAPLAFVAAFLAAAALASSTDDLQPLWERTASFGRTGLTLALFALGLSLDRTALGQLNLRVALLGATLWLALAALALALV
jgi:uncharacterized integral membrane protein (TIGR00698 family)